MGEPTGVLGHAPPEMFFFSDQPILGIVVLTSGVCGNEDMIPFLAIIILCMTNVVG